MSKDEMYRLVHDVVSNPAMIEEAMTIQDQAAMEGFIAAKGYVLTMDEMREVWAMTAKVMAGHSMPMEEVQHRINTVKREAMAAQE